LAFALASAQTEIKDPRELVIEGDRHYARRAEGAQGFLAKEEQIVLAIHAYRRAIAIDHDAVPARARLLRALFFRGSFCGLKSADRRGVLDDAKRLAEEGVEGVELKIHTPRIASLQGIEGSASLYFWAAVSWGQWALDRGKFASARHGAAGRIRDLAQTVVDLDPYLEQGGGDRILGRLHDQTPRIPLLTGWVSREQALVHLRRALALGPDNTVNEFFLAEALLSHARADVEEARRLLVSCRDRSPREEFLVEDSYYSDLSRRRLEGLVRAGASTKTGWARPGGASELGESACYTRSAE